MMLLFLRHGISTHNADAMVRGDVAYFDPIHTDAALTDDGVEQVLVRRDEFHTEYDAIYCSPLRRCRQTLLGIMPRANTLPVVCDDRIMEPQGNALCNKRSERDVVVTSSPPAWDVSGVAEANPFDSWVEQYSKQVDEMPEFCARVREFTESLVKTHANKGTILIVSHHDWIRTWFHLYKGVSLSPNYAGLLWAALDAKQKVD